MSGYPLLEVGTPPPYNEQVIWAQWPELKTKIDEGVDSYSGRTVGGKVIRGNNDKVDSDDVSEVGSNYVI